MQVKPAYKNEECPQCDGCGMDGSTICVRCGGHGRILAPSTERPFDVKAFLAAEVPTHYLM